MKIILQRMVCRRASRTYFIPAVVIALLQVVAPLSATASGGVVSMSRSVSSLSGDGGGSVTVTAGTPVAAPGTVSQTITQTFDPTRAKLTGAGDITAPSGWTLSYSSDGATFGAAPNNSAGWAAVRSVRATGSILSGGDSSGLQIANGTATGTVPTSGAFSSGGGGDGWDVAFDEQGNVYNTFHHDGYWGSGFITPGLHCHTRTGAVCGPGWPFSLRIANGVTGPGGIVGQPWYHTNDQAMQWVDTVNNRVWVPTNLSDGTAASGLGFVCVDVSDLAVGPQWCGGDINNAFVRLSTSVCGGRDCTLGLAPASGRLFAWDSLTGKLLCMDPFGTRSGNLPGAPCANQPYTIPSVSSVALSGYSLMAAQGLVWGAAQGVVTCFDPDALALCAAWSASASIGATLPNMSFDVPTSTGLPGAVCFTRYEVSIACFDANGTSSTALSGSHLASGLMTYVSAAVTPRRVTTTILPKYAVTTGTRVYWSDGAWPGGGKIYCWDQSLSSGAGAACANWPVNNSAYTATIDAQNPNCIWTNTDSGAITQIDAVTGGSTCVTPPPIAEFSAPVMLPRLACTNSASIQSWRHFKLTAPLASTYSTATLTVLTSTGRSIVGWNRVTIPAGSRTVDLSTLPVSASGVAPRFRVALNDKTTNDAISAEVSAIGDAPQLCLSLQTLAACPTSPSRIAGSMPSPDPLTVAGSGTAQPASGSAQQFTAANASVSLTPPSDATCLGTISGTTTMQSDSSAVGGAQVRLLDANGVVVAETTSDVSGAYSFTRLAAGSGYRVEFGPATTGSANASTVTATSVDRIVTANAVTTVNGSYGVLRTNALSANTEHNQAVTLTPAPHDSMNAQTYTSFTRSATCVVDPADRVCKSSVSISGEGIWTTNASTGELIFTPNTGFVGASTSVTYRVTESSSSWTTWNTARVTVAAATTTTSTTVVPTTTVTTTTNSGGQSSATTTTTTAATTTTVPRPVVVPASNATRAASTGILMSSVYAPSPGRIRQVGLTSSAGLTTTACTSRMRTVTRAGSFSTSCQLTSNASTTLRTSSVQVVLVTRFVGNDGTVRVTRTKVTLRRPRELPVTR